MREVRVFPAVLTKQAIISLGIFLKVYFTKSNSTRTPALFTYVLP